MIMEAEKSHDLPFASWRPRKASGVIPVQTQRLRARKASLALKAQELGG